MKGTYPYDLTNHSGPVGDSASTEHNTSMRRHPSSQLAKYSRPNADAPISTENKLHHTQKTADTSTTSVTLDTYW